MPSDASWSASSEFLLHATITGGVGLAAVGLDRGEIGPSLLARADVFEGGVAVTAVNTAFGWTTGADAARAAATASFAESVLAHVAGDADGFDAAPLGLVDLLAAGRTISAARGVRFAIVPELSRVDRVTRHDDVLAVDAVLTFAAAAPDPAQRAASGVSPVGGPPGSLGHPAPTDAISVRQQVVLRPLPAGG